LIASNQPLFLKDYPVGIEMMKKRLHEAGFNGNTAEP
jgi:hypothetical protein